MSDETWDTIKKRREAKLKSEAGRVDDREVELARAEFWSLHSEVRRRLAKRDKRRQINEKVAETEVLLNKNDGQSQMIAYKAIKELKKTNRTTFRIAAFRRPSSEGQPR